MKHNNGLIIALITGLMFSFGCEKRPKNKVSFNEIQADLSNYENNMMVFRVSATAPEMIGPTFSRTAAGRAGSAFAAEVSDGKSDKWAYFGEGGVFKDRIQEIYRFRNTKITILALVLKHLKVNRIELFVLEYGDGWQPSRSWSQNARNQMLEGAIRSNDLEMARKLLQVGADANYVRSGSQYFPMIAHASGQNKIEMIELLHSHGADLNAYDFQGLSALHHAALADNLEAIEKLIELGVDIDIKGFKHGATPLHKAAGKNNIKAVEKLIEMGANINAEDKDGATPLVYATVGEAKEVTDLLINLGALEHFSPKE